jgi:hypothetical protein
MSGTPAPGPAPPSARTWQRRSPPASPSAALPPDARPVNASWSQGGGSRSRPAGNRRALPGTASRAAAAPVTASPPASTRREQPSAYLGRSRQPDVPRRLRRPRHRHRHRHRQPRPRPADPAHLGAPPATASGPAAADHGEVIGHEIACPVQRGDQRSVGPDPGREVSVPGVRRHPACSRPIATSTTARWSATCEHSAASATEATGACPGVVISAPCDTSARPPGWRMCPGRPPGRLGSKGRSGHERNADGGSRGQDRWGRRP